MFFYIFELNTSTLFTDEIQVKASPGKWNITNATPLDFLVVLSLRTVTLEVNFLLEFDLDETTLR